jgi:hypothetical protein
MQTSQEKPRCGFEVTIGSKVVRCLITEGHRAILHNGKLTLDDGREASVSWRAYEAEVVPAQTVTF